MPSIAIKTTNTALPSGAIVSPATVAAPANALFHILPRGNDSSFYDTTGNYTPSLPEDAEFEPDGGLFGKTRRFSMGTNPFSDLPFLTSVVVYLDPSNGNIVPILGNVLDDGTSQGIIAAAYFPALGIFQISARVESAAGVSSKQNFNLAYASTNAGWVNFNLLIQSDRLYAFCREQDGTRNSAATSIGLGVRTPADAQIYLGGNSELVSTQVQPFKVAEVFAQTLSFVDAATTYDATLDATKSRLATVGIILP